MGVKGTEQGYVTVCGHKIKWADVHPSLTRSILYDRIKKSKMPIERAISEPKGVRTPDATKWITIQGKRVKMPEFVHPSLTRRVIYNRVHVLKYSLEDACRLPADHDYRTKESWYIAGHVLAPGQVKTALANGLTYQQVANRLRQERNPWTIERAITEPLIKRTKKKPEKKVKAKEVKEVKVWKKVALNNGIPLDVYLKRVYKDGISPEEAAKK